MDNVSDTAATTGALLQDRVEFVLMTVHEFSARFLEDFDQASIPALHHELSVRIGNRSSADMRTFDVRVFAVSEGRKPDASESKTAFLEIKVTLDLRYRVHDDAAPATPKEIEQFANANALFNAWPFLRESIHSLCTRAGVPPVVVPLLRIPTPPALEDRSPAEV